MNKDPYPPFTPKAVTAAHELFWQQQLLDQQHRERKRSRRRPLPWWLVVILSLLAVLAAAWAIDAVVSAPSAHAEQDSHIPDPPHDFCPGSGIATKLAWGVCDGARYPDGTYWHVQGFMYTLVNVYCAAGTPGDVAPPPAPAGGCNGLPVPVINTSR